TMAAFTTGDFIDLIEKNDSAALHALDSDTRDLVHVHQLLLFFLHEIVHRFAHAHLALAGAPGEQTGQHVLEVDVHLLDAAGGGDFKRRAAFADVDLHHAVVELART